MKIEAIYSINYGKGSIEISDGNTTIYEDWLDENEIHEISIQCRDAYLEFSRHELYNLLEGILWGAENLESVESEEYSEIIARLQQAIKLLSE